MEEFGKLEERVVLVGVQTDDHDNVEESFRIVSLCIPELILEKES